MTKVMVVEDDASLREIYSIRITAEGYDVITAGDGEEALAVAVREKPDLILADVMMPKISGFDMLDILRATPETAKIKVVMMTALSGDDQRERGERLGADRYLVKSQVGIEDMVNTIHEVLGDKEIASMSPTPIQTPTNPAPATPTPASPPEPTPHQPVVIPRPAESNSELAPATPAPAPLATPTSPAPAPTPTLAPTPTINPEAPHVPGSAQ